MSRRVPKLRFKEFSGEWDEKRLENVYDFHSTNSFSRDKLNYEKGIVKNIHYGDIHTKFSTLFDITKEQVPFINSDIDLTRVKKESYCLEGDLIFADASEDVDDIGKSIELINLNNEKVLSGLHTLLARQKEKKLVKGFAGYLFKSNYIREQIKKEAQGAKVLGISAKRLSNIKLFFPKDQNEQQKIANTLSSLDKFIEAGEKKVEALKKHKKGLMQQLFPQEGEKTPKLRFEEFSGEWEESLLGNYCEITTGKLDANAMVENGKYRFYTCAKEYYLIDKYQFDTEALLISGNGANVGYIHYYNGKFNAYQRTYVLDQFQIKVHFLKYFLQKNLHQRILIEKKDGNTPYIVMSTLTEMPILLPTLPEQEKIADTLSFLDNLIEAGEKKVEALKKYKKGLMQQMFVSEE